MTPCDRALITVRMVEVILRRPIRKPARRAGGRPRKPESHSHVATIQGRVTPPEHVVFQRILAEREAKGLPGFENATEWIRAVLHEQAVALGVSVPAEYHDVRRVRALNWERAEAPLSGEASAALDAGLKSAHEAPAVSLGSFAADAGEAENCQTPSCPNAIGECGVFCDRCTDEILSKPLHATL